MWFVWACAYASHARRDLKSCPIPWSWVIVGCEFLDVAAGN